MVRPWPLACVFAFLAFPAAAQPPPTAPPVYPLPPVIPPGFMPSPPIVTPPPPGYRYEPMAGYVPQGLPLSPPAEPLPTLRWSLRYEPLDLVQRRVTFQVEVGVVGPLTLEIAPTWIGGSSFQGVDEKGFAMAGNAVVYLSGQMFRGGWIKAHVAYENFRATLSNPLAPVSAGLTSAPESFGSAVLGVLVGNTWVLPRSGGFVLSGGIGVGITTAPTAVIQSGSNAQYAPVSVTLYEGFDRVRLLSALGMGVCF